MTPDTRYPVLGSEVWESVARELGTSGAGRMGDDGWIRMPRNRAEMGLGRIEGLKSKSDMGRHFSLAKSNAAPG